MPEYSLIETPLLDRLDALDWKVIDQVADKPAYGDAANTGTGWKNANLRSQFLKLLKKAKVSPWPRLFHSMRASRQTELERQYPTYVVCSWIGNSLKIARESYLLATEDDFTKAAVSDPSETKNSQWHEKRYKTSAERIAR